MDDAEVERSGQLFRFDPDHSWSLQDKGYRVTNGPAFSSDGRTMYHSDSAAQLIYQFELNETGEATNRRIFSSFGEGEGSPDRSEEHTSELQSLMRNSYAVFCFTKKTTTTYNTIYKSHITN